jgi:hypothetical protein
VIAAWPDGYAWRLFSDPAAWQHRVSSTSCVDAKLRGHAPRLVVHSMRPFAAGAPLQSAAKLGRGTPVYRLSHMVMAMAYATASAASTAAATARRVRARNDRRRPRAGTSSARAPAAPMPSDSSASSQPGTVLCTSGYEYIAAW